MEKWVRIHIALAAGILLVLIPAACGTVSGPASNTAEDLAHKVQERIKPLVESLYIKVKDLEMIHLGLRSVANAHAFLPDDLLLSHIQKAALYVDNALKNASCQREFFSIMEDIKPDALQDYYTLRHKSLRKGADEIRYDMHFLKIYQTFITSAEAREDIHGALAVIAEIQEIYQQLMDAIAPLVPQGVPTSI